jgi:GNAT superfamily N-acetyltransferase
VTEESLLRDGERHPPEAGRRAWVAPGGYAFARRMWEVRPPGTAALWIGVDPALRRRGIGGGLYDVALAHVRALGAERVQTWATDAGAEFLERRGWRRIRERLVSAVEEPPPELEPPPGIGLAPLSAVDPRALYELDTICAGDEPGDTLDFGSFESYCRNELERPLLDLDGSFAALAEGQPVAISIIFRHETVAHNGFTCTHPDWRGRGLARFVKTATLRHAFEHGARRVATMNDAENPAMLHVNDGLGYRPVRTEAQLQLPLTERTSGVSSNQSTTLTEQ